MNVWRTAFYLWFYFKPLHRRLLLKDHLNFYGFILLFIKFYNNMNETNFPRWRPPTTNLYHNWKHTQSTRLAFFFTSHTLVHTCCYCVTNWDILAPNTCQIIICFYRRCFLPSTACVKLEMHLNDLEQWQQRKPWLP